MIIELRGLSVRAGGKLILSDVSFGFDRGNYLALVGANGSGKSTLLKAIVGLVEYEGSVRLSGMNPRRMSRRELARHVAYVAQRPIIPAGMSVGDYVVLGRFAHHSYLGSPTRRDRQVVGAALERLDLSALADRRLGQLSGGESQRVVLARALVQEAPILLMDEPTASLDLGRGQMVLELADELRRERSLSVICAIHDLTLAAQYADQLVVLAGGRLVLQGTAASVLNRENVESYFDASVEILAGRSGLSVTPVRPSDRHVLTAVPPSAPLKVGH